MSFSTDNSNRDHSSFGYQPGITNPQEHEKKERETKERGIDTPREAAASVSSPSGAHALNLTQSVHNEHTQASPSQGSSPAAATDTLARDVIPKANIHKPTREDFTWGQRVKVFFHSSTEKEEFANTAQQRALEAADKIISLASALNGLNPDDAKALKAFGEQLKSEITDVRKFDKSSFKSIIKNINSTKARSVENGAAPKRTYQQIIDFGQTKLNKIKERIKENTIPPTDSTTRRLAFFTSESLKTLDTSLEEIKGHLDALEENTADKVTNSPILKRCKVLAEGTYAHITAALNAKSKKTEGRRYERLQSELARAEKNETLNVGKLKNIEIINTNYRKAHKALTKAKANTAECREKLGKALKQVDSGSELARLVTPKNAQRSLAELLEEHNVPQLKEELTLALDKESAAQELADRTPRPSSSQELEQAQHAVEQSKNTITRLKEKLEASKEYAGVVGKMGRHMEKAQGDFFLLQMHHAELKQEVDWAEKNEQETIGILHATKKSSPQYLAATEDVTAAKDYTKECKEKFTIMDKEFFQPFKKIFLSDSRMNGLPGSLYTAENLKKVNPFMLTRKNLALLNLSNATTEKELEKQLEDHEDSFSNLKTNLILNALGELDPENAFRAFGFVNKLDQKTDLDVSSTPEMSELNDIYHTKYEGIAEAANNVRIVEALVNDFNRTPTPGILSPNDQRVIPKPLIAAQLLRSKQALLRLQDGLQEKISKRDADLEQLVTTNLTPNESALLDVAAAQVEESLRQIDKVALENGGLEKELNLTEREEELLSTLKKMPPNTLNDRKLIFEYQKLTQKLAGQASLNNPSAQKKLNELVILLEVTPELHDKMKTQSGKTSVSNLKTHASATATPDPMSHSLLNSLDLVRYVFSDLKEQYKGNFEMPVNNYMGFILDRTKEKMALVNEFDSSENFKKNSESFEKALVKEGFFSDKSIKELSGKERSDLLMRIPKEERGQVRENLKTRSAEVEDLGVHIIELAKQGNLNSVGAFLAVHRKVVEGKKIIDGKIVVIRQVEESPLLQLLRKSPEFNRAINHALDDISLLKQDIRISQEEKIKLESQLRQKRAEEAANLDAEMIPIHQAEALEGANKHNREVDKQHVMTPIQQKALAKLEKATTDKDYANLSPEDLIAATSAVKILSNRIKEYLSLDRETISPENFKARIAAQKLNIALLKKDSSAFSEPLKNIITQFKEEFPSLLEGLSVSSRASPSSNIPLSPLEERAQIQLQRVYSNQRLSEASKINLKNVSPKDSESIKAYQELFIKLSDSAINAQVYPNQVTELATFLQINHPELLTAILKDPLVGSMLKQANKDDFSPSLAIFLKLQAVIQTDRPGKISSTHLDLVENLFDLELRAKDNPEDLRLQQEYQTTAKQYNQAVLQYRLGEITVDQRLFLNALSGNSLEALSGKRLETFIKTNQSNTEMLKELQTTLLVRIMAPYNIQERNACRVNLQQFDAPDFQNRDPAFIKAFAAANAFFREEAVHNPTLARTIKEIADLTKSQIFDSMRGHFTINTLDGNNQAFREIMAVYKFKPELIFDLEREFGSKISEISKKSSDVSRNLAKLLGFHREMHDIKISPRKELDLNNIVGLKLSMDNFQAKLPANDPAKAEIDFLSQQLKDLTTLGGDVPNAKGGYFELSTAEKEVLKAVNTFKIEENKGFPPSPYKNKDIAPVLAKMQLRLMGDATLSPSEKVSLYADIHQMLQKLGNHQKGWSKLPEFNTYFAPGTETSTKANLFSHFSTVFLTKNYIEQNLPYASIETSLRVIAPNVEAYANLIREGKSLNPLQQSTVNKYLEKIADLKAKVNLKATESPSTQKDANRMLKRLNDFEKALDPMGISNITKTAVKSPTATEIPLGPRRDELEQFDIPSPALARSARFTFEDEPKRAAATPTPLTQEAPTRAETESVPPSPSQRQTMSLLPPEPTTLKQTHAAALERESKEVAEFDEPSEDEPKRAAAAAPTPLTREPTTSTQVHEGESKEVAEESPEERIPTFHTSPEVKKAYEEIERAAKTASSPSPTKAPENYQTLKEKYEKNPTRETAFALEKAIMSNLNILNNRNRELIATHETLSESQKRANTEKILNNSKKLMELHENNYQVNKYIYTENPTPEMESKFKEISQNYRKALQNFHSDFENFNKELNAANESNRFSRSQKEENTKLMLSNSQTLLDLEIKLNEIKRFELKLSSNPMQTASRRVEVAEELNAVLENLEKSQKPAFGDIGNDLQIFEMRLASAKDQLPKEIFNALTEKFQAVTIKIDPRVKEKVKKAQKLEKELNAVLENLEKSQKSAFGDIGNDLQIFKMRLASAKNQLPREIFNALTEKFQEVIIKVDPKAQEKLTEVNQEIKLIKPLLEEFEKLIKEERLKEADAIKDHLTQLCNSAKAKITDLYQNHPTTDRKPQALAMVNIREQLAKAEKALEQLRTNGVIARHSKKLELELESLEKLASNDFFKASNGLAIFNVKLKAEEKNLPKEIFEALKEKAQILDDKIHKISTKKPVESDLKRMSESSTSEAGIRLEFTKLEKLASENAEKSFMAASSGISIFKLQLAIAKAKGTLSDEVFNDLTQKAEALDKKIHSKSDVKREAKIEEEVKSKMEAGPNVSLAESNPITQSPLEKAEKDYQRQKAIHANPQKQTPETALAFEKALELYHQSIQKHLEELINPPKTQIMSSMKYLLDLDGENYEINKDIYGLTGSPEAASKFEEFRDYYSKNLIHFSQDLAEYNRELHEENTKLSDNDPQKGTNITLIRKNSEEIEEIENKLNEIENFQLLLDEPSPESKIEAEERAPQPISSHLANESDTKRMKEPDISGAESNLTESSLESKIQASKESYEIHKKNYENNRNDETIHEYREALSNYRVNLRNLNELLKHQQRNPELTSSPLKKMDIGAKIAENNGILSDLEIEVSHLSDRTRHTKASMTSRQMPSEQESKLSEEDQPAITPPSFTSTRPPSPSRAAPRPLPSLKATPSKTRSSSSAEIKQNHENPLKIEYTEKAYRDYKNIYQDSKGTETEFIELENFRGAIESYANALKIKNENLRKENLKTSTPTVKKASNAKEIGDNLLILEEIDDELFKLKRSNS